MLPSDDADHLKVGCLHRYSPVGVCFRKHVLYNIRKYNCKSIRFGSVTYFVLWQSFDLCLLCIPMLLFHVQCPFPSFSLNYLQHHKEGVQLFK